MAISQTFCISLTKSHLYVLKFCFNFLTEPLTSLQEEDEESNDFKEPFVYDPSRPTMVNFPSALAFPTLDSEKPFKPPKGKYCKSHCYSHYVPGGQTRAKKMPELLVWIFVFS